VGDDGPVQDRDWTLPVAAALGALEATVAIAAILFRGHRSAGALVVFLAVKYPLCWWLLRRRAAAWFAMLLWEGTVVFAVVFAPRIAIGFRLVEGGLAAAVIGLLAMSARLFPSPELPRP